MEEPTTAVVEARTTDGRFKKGVSGNPAGRAPTVQREIISIQQEIEHAVRKHVTAKDVVAVIAATIVAAKDGDAKARKLVFEYFIGKPKQNEEVADKSERILIRIENATFKAQQDEKPPLEGNYTEVTTNG